MIKRYVISGFQLDINKEEKGDVRYGVYDCIYIWQLTTAISCIRPYHADQKFLSTQYPCQNAAQALVSHKVYPILCESKFVFKRETPEFPSFTRVYV